MKTKKHLKLDWFFLLLLCLTACSKGDDPELTPDKKELIVSSTENLSPVLGVEGGTATVSFTAASEWTASVINTRADNWVSVSPSGGGKGNVTISITATPNDTPDERNATVILKCGNATKNIVLSQKQKDALTVTTSKYEVEQKGGNIQVEVKANVAFNVVIPETSKGWIQEVEAQSRGLEASVLNFSIAPNGETEKREGEIIIQNGELSETVRVYQVGGRIILLDEKERYVSDQGEVIQVEIKSNVDYEVKMPGVDWIKEAASVRALSTHTLFFEVAASNEYDSRMAEIIFKDKTSSVSDTLRVVQVQKDAIVLSKKKYEVSSLGEDVVVEYNTNVDCQIEIPSGCAWITQVEDANTRGLTLRKLLFRIAANLDKEVRTGSIILSAKESQKKETIEVVQEGFNYYLKLSRIDDNSNLACDYKGGEFGFDVESDGPYKMEVLGDDTSWVHYLRKEERGPNTYCEVFLMDKNDTDVEKKVRFRFSLGPIVHEFNFAVCEKRELSFSQTEFNASSEGGKFSLEIKAGGEWSKKYKEFWDYSILKDATSWVSVERNTKPGSSEDTAFIVIQPNLTSQPRESLILFYVFAGEKYQIRVTQSAQGVVVLSPSSYILSSDQHSLTVELAASDYAVEISDEAAAWISLGAKTGEGTNAKQELLIAANTTPDERKGTVVFVTNEAKNQLMVTQLMTPPELVDDTPAKWKQFQLPEIKLIFNNPQSEGTQIYKAIVPDCEALVHIASRKVLDCLYSEPDNSLIPRQKEMEYVLEDYDGASYNVNSGQRIVLSNQYLAMYYKKNGAQAMIKENIGVLSHELTHSYQMRPQNCGGYQPGTHYHVFIEGVADAVRVLCGGFPNENDRPKGGSYMDSYRYTGFFLAWLVKNKDADFLRKFNMSAHDLKQWSFDAGIKYALGENYNADDLWTEYLKAMGDIQ